MAPIESPQMGSTVKLPILKKGKYTLWSMRMEQYLTNTDYGLWQVILNGDGPIQVTKDDDGVETEVPPKTAQAILARQRERKAKSIFLLVIPDEYQLRFHAIKDAKTLWAAIKSRLGGNVEFKKMQKNVLKQQFENFSVSDTEGLDKAYDRFQKLINLLEVHEDTSSSNEVNTANGVSTAAGYSSQEQASSSLYADDLMFSFFANQSNSPQLDDEDLEQIDHDDLEEMDLKWQVAMLSMRKRPFCKGMQSTNKSREHEWRCKSYITQDEPTEFALMAYTSNSSGSDTEANLEIVAYQLGLESIEAQLIVHQKNEVVYEEKIAVLEFEVKDKNNAITRFKNKLDETLREKDDLKAKLEQFETSSKNLNKLINSQLSAKDRTGLGYGDQLNENDSSGSEVFNSVFENCSSDRDGNQANDRFKKGDVYHAVPPPFTSNYMPSLANLSFARLDDSVYRPTANKTSASVFKVETSISQTPRVESVRSSEVLIKEWDILTRFGRVPVSAAKQSSLRAAVSTQVNIVTNRNQVNVSKPRINTFHKSHLPIRRPFYKSTTPNTRILNEKINVVRVNGVNTAGQIAVSVVERNGVTAVKASTGCVWRPRMSNLNNGNPQQALKNKGILNSGCSRHMTGNKDFLTDYHEIDGGFGAFGGSTRGGKITSKGKIKTDKLDFEDVFFVKELKFNLFSVSQMCDKKNSVLFTKTKCIVLSPDFKLLDKSQVLLRVPRQSNMYSFDLKNVVPSKDLTCLFPKATLDESNLWHRRLGHRVRVIMPSPVAIRTFSDGWDQSFVPLGISFPIDVTNLPHDPLMPDLEDIAEVQSTGIFGNAYNDDDLDTYNYPYADQAVGAKAGFNNMELSTVDPKKIAQALDDESWFCNNARGRLASSKDSEDLDSS
ncbi:hypothetical protein Tco_0299273 [Tanacetum coccineum]